MTKTLQGASLELSPPLLHSYIVKGVTVPVTHPVNFETFLQQSCNSGIAHVKIRVNITYVLYLSEY